MIIIYILLSPGSVLQQFGTYKIFNQPAEELRSIIR